MIESLVRGILPDFMLKGIVENTTRQDQIQPASYEPFVLEEAWEVKGFGNMSPSSRIENRIQKIRDIRSQELKRGKIYEVQFAENLSIPPALFGKVSPKSTIGRTGTYVLTYTEDGKYVNKTPFGYNGKLFAYVQPRSFNIILGKIALSQIRFQTIDAQVTENEIRQIWTETPLLRDVDYSIPIPSNGIEFNSNGLVLHADVGDVYIPTPNDVAVKLTKENLAKVYWKNVGIQNKSFVAEEGACHILGSLEGIVTPNYLASELREYSEGYMSFHQAHIAGFIDPGFGYPRGNSLTFELTPYSPMSIRHGQPLGVIDYYKMISEPKKPYDGNYVKSKHVRLAKCFVDLLEETKNQQTLILD